MSEPEVGEDFAGYHIDAEIGRGGMSVVYRATELGDLERPVALKVMASFLARDETYRARFLREARTAANLHHPGIIPVYAFAHHDDALFLVMQLVEGQDLHHRIHGTTAPLEVDEVLAILRQAADALDSVHNQGVTHRDVKPANLLLDEAAGRPGAPHVYLVDFGIARAADAVQLTGSGQVLGTLAYAAPELLRNEAVDGRTDQYALGCVAFEALTGHRPFEQEADMALMYAQLQDPVPSATARRPDLPAAVDPAIARAMAKDPDDRWPTCVDLVDALEVACRGGPAADAPTVPAGAGATVRLAGAPGPPEGTPGPVGEAGAGGAGPRRHLRRPLLVGGGLVLCVLAVVGLLTLLATARDDLTTSAPSGPPAGTGSGTVPGPGGSTPPITPALEGAMLQISSIVSLASQDRASVEQAIAGLQSCQIQPAAATASLQTALTNRQTQSAGIPAVSTGGDPTARTLLELLEDAFQASILADTGYIKWSQGLAARADPCPGGKADLSDPDYVAASDDSSRSTQAKEAFLAVYNPVAAATGYPTYRATQI